MAPNLDSPSSTGTKSTEESSQLVYIENTLRRLEKDTLRIKRKNDEIINSFDRRDPDPIQNREAPPKPPRRPPQPKPRQKPEVTRALQESADLRQQVHNTLRECTLAREKHREFMNVMKLESQQLTSIKLGSYATANPASSVLNKFRGFLKKLSYSDSSTPHANVQFKPSSVPISLQTNPEIEKVVKDPVEIDGQNSEKATSWQKPRTPPIPKPRIKSKIKIAPPPPIATLDDLRRICQTTTDDESTLPPPGHNNISKESLQNDVRAIEADLETGEESDDSSPDFGEYIQAPLLVRTLSASTDSEESILGTSTNTPTKSGYSKNRKVSVVPRAYRKPKVEVAQETPENLIYREKLGALRRDKLPRPPSPPPRKLIRKSSLQSTLGNLAEENVIEVPDSVRNGDHLLIVPSSPRLNSPPPKVLEKVEDFSGPEDNDFAPQIQISALCPGVAIRPLEISVTPWTELDKPTYRIYEPEPEMNPHEFNTSEQNVSGDVDVQETIDRDFAFLCGAEDCQLENVERQNEPVPERNGENEGIVEGVDRSFEKLVRTGSSPQVKADDSACVGDTGLESPPVDDVKTSDADKIKISEVNTTVLNHPSENWNQLVDSASEKTYETIKSCIYSDSVVSESEERFEIQTEKQDNALQMESNRVQPEPHVERADADTDLKPPTLPKTAPPLPPAMPLVPIFLDTIGHNKNKNLPITPLTCSSNQPTIFDTLRPSAKKLDLGLDMKFIQDNFNQENTSTMGNGRRTSFMSKESPNKDASNQSAVSFLTQQRRQVICIGTKKLKLEGLTGTTSILAALRSLDVAKFSIDDLQILMQILPKDNETTIYKSLETKACETLCQEDRLMKSLSEIPDVTKKLEAMTYIMSFDETFRILESEIFLLQRAAQSVKNSVQFPTIIQVVLFVINKAFVKDEEPLKGFEINSLQRLSSKKSVDGKVSLLHCIIKCLESMYPEVIHFYDDFVDIDGASKISKTDVNTLLYEMETGLTNVKHVISTINASGDQQTLNGLLKATEFVEKSSTQLANIKARWQKALEEVQKVTEYFGMSVKQSEDIRDFFVIILNFVNDYKKALSQNEKLFKSLNKDSKPENCADGGSKVQEQSKKTCADDLDNPVVKRRDKPASSWKADLNKRKSLGNLKEFEESGQPSEFLDAVSKIGQLNADARIRRRSSYYGGATSRLSGRKSDIGLKNDETRERS